MTGWAHPIRENFLNLFFPPRCQCCRKFHRSILCDECRAQFAFIEPPFCQQCGMPFDPLAETGALCGQCQKGALRLERVRSVLHYRDVAREAIHNFKYQGRARLAEPLGDLMSEMFEQFFGDLVVHMLMPVPLHRSRERHRGFNQALLLARWIGQGSGIAVCANVLLRVKATRPQIELTAAQRAENVRGAFSVKDPEAVAGKNVLLVDDMCTTGATLSECARTLKRAGAARVFGYTLARG